MMKKTHSLINIVRNFHLVTKKLVAMGLILLPAILLLPIAADSKDTVSTHGRHGATRLTPKESAWLKHHPEIRVAVKTGWMPIEFKAESEQHRGISVDYLQALSKLFNVRFIPVNYTENISPADADMISGIGSSKLELPHFKKLSQPFLDYPLAIYANKNVDHQIDGIDDLNHKKVAIFRNATIAKEIADNYPQVALVYVGIADEAFDKLRLGEVDAYVGNQMVIDYHIVVHRLNFVEKIGITPFNATVYMAVRDDMPELASILSKGLQAIGTNNQKILDKWKISDNPYDDWIMLILGIISVALLFGFFRIFKLKRAIKLQNIESQKMIWHQANYDYLTDLPNRHLLDSRLKQAMTQADRSLSPMGILFIDLDNFKHVNDIAGHSIGDKLIKEAALRITRSVRSYDTTARFGGDEFMVIMSDFDDEQALVKTSQKILAEIEKPFEIEGEIFYISASIGLTLYPNDTANPEALLSYADQAMYEAKKLGRNRFQFFKASMQSDSANRLALMNDMREAIAQQQFELYYQPIISIASQQVLKAEALIRWNHPVKGMISPVEFIPLAEEVGLIDEIGSWVFNQTLRDIKLIHAQYSPEFQVSVNVSPNQFSKYEHLLAWKHKLANAGVTGASICIEITEGLLLQPSASVVNTLAALRESGIQFSIDDFGTGYSALAYLNKFDIEYVKIDQSFIQNLSPDNYDAILCEAIISMAHKLGIKVIAEGVETEAQLRLLNSFQCDYGQGYLIAKPKSFNDFRQFLSAQGNQPHLN